MMSNHKQEKVLKDFYTHLLNHIKFQKCSPESARNFKELAVHKFCVKQTIIGTHNFKQYP